MAKYSYSIRITTAPLPPAVDLDQAVSAVAEGLEEDATVKAPIVAANLATRTLSLTASVDVADLGTAAAAASRAFGRAVVHARLTTTVSAIQAEIDSDVGDRQELVSGGEVARRLGLSRERVRQLSESGSLPTPAAVVGGYRVWRLGEILDWAAIHERKVARRRKKSA